MLPRQVALARHHSYLLFGRLFLEGLTPPLLPYVRALPELNQELSGRPDFDTIAAQHFQLLGMELPPYESVFLASDGLLGGAVSEALASIYRQFDFSPNTAASSPDHIGNELAALAHLCHREAGTSRGSQAFNADIARRQQLRLLREHLLQWLAPFSIAIRRQGDPFHMALSEICLDLVRQHYSSLTQPPPSSPVENPSGSNAIELLDDERASLREISDYLMIPYRSGIYLSRSDIARLGRRLNLPRGFGDRRQTLLNLMRTAAQYDQFQAMVGDFKREVGQGLEEYHRLRERMPELGPFILPWEVKLGQTHSMLARLEAGASEIGDQSG